MHKLAQRLDHLESRLTLQLRSFNIPTKRSRVCGSIIFSYIRKVLKKESELECEAGMSVSVNEKETLSYDGLSSLSQLLKRYKTTFLRFSPVNYQKNG